MVDIYNYYNEKPLFDQNLVACNQTRNNPLMFPDEMFCNENPTWSSIVIANIVFASFGIVLSTVLIFICFDALRDGCYVIFYSRWRRMQKYCFWNMGFFRIYFKTSLTRPTWSGNIKWSTIYVYFGYPIIGKIIYSDIRNSL